MNPPGDDYTELQAAHDWRVPLDRWYLIHPSYRAKMIAFSVFRAKQENYMHDFAIKEAKKKTKKSDQSYETLTRLMK